MKFKMLRFSLILVVYLWSVPAVSAQENNQLQSWNLLKSYLSQEIAVKTKNQKTVFGVLREINDSELKIEIVKKNYNSEITLSRAEVKKIWRARLQFGRKTIVGAGIGAGVGTGLGFLWLRSPAAREDGQAAVAVPFLAVAGGGIGAVIGFIAPKKHQKKQLVYQN